MTFKITTEQLGPLTVEGFDQMVAARIETLREYDAHEAVVRQHAAIPDMVDPWVSLAVPQSDLDAAIRVTARDDGTHDFAPDYEIVPLSLDKRKAKLSDQVSAAEREAIHSVLPPGKIRAYQFREQDIRQADQARYREAETARVAAKLPDPINFVKFSADNRPVADTRFLEEQTARDDQRNEIQRWAANLHSDIEDLTEATVDAWEMKLFHG